ncbi:MAG: hypothetical protein HY672_03445 [Chloroflexi bacterium]|nr:hypothetical protein [Chloroflexota bacterium]
MKKSWFLVALVVGVLALGLTGGAVLAQDSETNSGDTPFGKFAARVATILGIDQTKVEDALKQAARETQDEALQSRLDKLVENGKLTQEQADAYKQWFLARPEGTFPGLQGMMGGRGFGMMGGRGGHGGGMMGDHGMGFWGQIPPTPTPQSSGTTGL